MKQLIVLLLLSSSVWAQQAPSKKYNYNEFNQIVNVEDQEKYFNEMLQVAPADNPKPEQYDAYLTNLAVGWLAKGNIEKYRYYTKTDPKFSFVALVNLIYALEDLEKDDQYLSIIKEVSRGMIDKIDKDATKDEMTRGRLQVLLELNAMANAKLGHVDVAVKNMERSSTIDANDRDMQYFKDSKSSYYDRYAIVMSAAGAHKKALDTLTKAVRQGDSKPKLVETLKQVYKKVHGSDPGADKLIASLQKEAYEKYYKEVEQSFIADVEAPITGLITTVRGDTIQAFKGNRPAGKISMPNIHSKMVNLADYKGKILVIDFWTTACAPCVAAFAGFERVVEDYKNEPFQLFAINLFEDQKTVQSFVAKKGITLDVLRDEPNAAYEVQATPTKIVFDPMGNIRFYAIGYAGSTDREYYKLKAMVEIVKARASGTRNVAEQRAQNGESTLASLQNEKGQAALQKKIKTLENGTAADLMVLVQYYNRDSVKKSAITKILNKKYPQSSEAGMARLMSFLDVKGGPEKTEAHFKSIRKAYPGVNMDLEQNLVALAYAEVPHAAKVTEYMNAMEDPVYRVAATTMNVDLIVPIDPALAFDMATKGLAGAKKLKGQTAPSEPLKVDPKTVYNGYINMYGKLLFKAGKNEEAYTYIKEAYNNIENKDAELMENYAFLSSSFDGNYEEALPILAQAVKEGKNEKRYIDQVRAGYEKLNPGKDVDAYIASLQQEFIDKIRSHVEGLMINEVAPDFSVTDVNGKKVTLADFKGKTIVLDFWATWCGPCVASFPAMQLAVNRYADDPNVKFLFIHTWENVADPLTDAKDFLSKRNYSFDLYMDPRDKTTQRSAAADAFNVDGIPAKFIIDGKGRIRFNASGFNGQKEEAAEELAQMIEMARTGA